MEDKKKESIRIAFYTHKFKKAGGSIILLSAEVVASSPGILEDWLITEIFEIAPVIKKPSQFKRKRKNGK